MSAEDELREQLRADLERHADRDPAFFAAFTSRWVARNVQLAELERLVDALDSIHPETQR